MSLSAAAGWGHSGFRARSSILALLGLLAVLALPIALDLRRAATLGMGDCYSDLVIWYQAATDLRENAGIRLYERHPGYLYPPLLLTLFEPLTRLAPQTATVAYQIGKWIALIVALRLAWRLCSPRGEDAPPIVALGSLLLTARFLENDFSIANVNTFVLCGVLLAAWLAARGATGLAGVLVGILASVKLTPALVLAYFVYKGWFRSLGGAALGVVLGLIAIPTLLLGWDHNLRLLDEWIDHLPAAFAEGTIRSTHTNQSITAIVNRLLGGSVAIPPDTFVTLVALPAWGRNAVRVVLSLAILALLAILCRRRFEAQREPLRYSAEISAVLIAMLALSGMSWKAHFVVLLPAFATLLTYLADRRFPDPPRATIAALTIVAAGLCVLTSDVVTPLGADYAEAYGLILLGALVAGAGVWRVHAALAVTPPGATDGQPARAA